MTEDATSRPEARAPRGFADRRGRDLVAERRLVQRVSEVYERWGFEPLDTGAFEYADALGKFLPDQDRPNEGVFSFQDDDEQWLSLRYDLTAPLARFVAENFDRLPKPYRSYRAGFVFRNEKPGPGRFRQFMQFDADTVGSASPVADAEVCMMAADTMEALAEEAARATPPARLVLLLGADAALALPRWRDPARIAATCELAVMLRPPHDRASFARSFAAAWGGSPPAISPRWVLDLGRIEASSTAVREGEPGDDLSPAVADYARAHRLYPASGGRGTSACHPPLG